MKFKHLTAVTGLALMLSVSACQTPELLSSEPASERPEVVAALDKDVEISSTQTILEGGLIGAGVGCLVGYLATGELAGCLVGGAGGAVAGGVAGAAVAEENERAALAEEKSDKLHKALVAEGEDIDAFGLVVNKALRRLEADLAKLESDRDNKRINAAQFEAKHASIARDAQALAKHTAEQRAEIEERNKELTQLKLDDKNAEQLELNFAKVDDAADSTGDFSIQVSGSGAGS